MQYRDTKCSPSILYRIAASIDHKSLQIAPVKLTVGEIKGARGLTSRFVVCGLTPDLLETFCFPSGGIFRDEDVLDFSGYEGGNGKLANLRAARFARFNSSFMGRKYWPRYFFSMPYSTPRFNTDLTCN